MLLHRGQFGVGFKKTFGPEWKRPTWPLKVQCDNDSNNFIPEKFCGTRRGSILSPGTICDSRTSVKDSEQCKHCMWGFFRQEGWDNDHCAPAPASGGRVSAIAQNNYFMGPKWVSPLEAFKSPKILQGRGMCVSMDTYPKKCKYKSSDPNMQCEKSIFDKSKTQACDDIEDRCMQCVECSGLGIDGGVESECAKEPSCEVKGDLCVNKEHKTSKGGILSCNTRERRMACLVDADCSHNNVGEDVFKCDQSSRQCIQVDKLGEPVRCEHDMTCGENARCSVKDIRMEGTCSEDGNVCFSKADCGYTFDREYINSLGKCVDFKSQANLRHQDADEAICKGLKDQGSCNQKRGCSWDGKNCVTFDEVNIAESKTCEGKLINHPVSRQGAILTRTTTVKITRIIVHQKFIMRIHDLTLNAIN